MATFSTASYLMKIRDQNPSKTADTELLILPLSHMEPTVNQVWGPFYVQCAPFRAKISPIGASGVPLIVTGHVFGLDTRRPLPFSCIDLWQTSSVGEYDYHEADPNIKYEYTNELNTHGRSYNFGYRVRLVTDEQGRYEYETVKPSAYYDADRSRWRCPHIHYYVQAIGYTPVITQLYFKGEEKNNTDPHIRESTTIELVPMERVCEDGSKLTYFKGEFDIIMASALIEK